ncbi:TonB-dependent receptor [Massilia sp. TS11]|uniref:TonB-dependent receptor n=1 Tax=Massilia sp. TS11 TaxID=2908003 RepID=UPI001EDA3C44|nr:TonB-dependent receptor [Massilia sp. TS11]MCG2585905.1 TonB-dependent receptor [Massilia sp. TS11]
MKKTAMAQAVTLALAAAALAQTAVAQENPGAIQRVEITGSSIKRAQAETASPVQVISRDDLVKSGKATVAEYLQTLTADGAGSLPTGFGNGFAAGSTAISLRGLGATATLVLLNGRRMAPFARADDGTKTFTDLSTIPMEAVDRIEVLKDGASSTYGADAIAGVVNIILRKDLQGGIVKVSGGESKYSDQEQAKGSITWGTGSLDKDGFNILLNAEVYKSNEIMNKDRSDRKWIGASDLRPYGYSLTGSQFLAGDIRGGVAGANPVGAIRDPKTLAYTYLPGCETLSKAVQVAGNGCVWGQDQFRSMQPQIDGSNLYARGTFNLNADTQFYTEAGYSKRDTHFTLTPPSVTPTVVSQNTVTSWGTLMTIGATHPQNPFGAAARIRYSAFDVGASTRYANNEFKRFVLGLKGSYSGWDYDTAVTYSDSALDLIYTNMLNMKNLQAGLNDPKSALFPFYIGAQASKNTQAQYDAIRATARSHSTTSLVTADFKASRELMALPGGNMGIAFGAEHRHEKVSNPSLSGTEDGSINASYVSTFGDTKVDALFVELAAPVLPTLELSAAARYDHYQNFNSTTPKVGAKWTPAKNFAVRGTFSQGFRAPGPAESNPLSASAGSAPVSDPVRCPGGKPAAGGATTGDCSTTVAGIKVGDPTLSPEKSKGYTLGMIWDPFNGTSIAIDAWKIKRSNEINQVTFSEAVAIPGNAIRSDNNLVVNGVVIPNSGTLLVIKAPYRNANFTEIKGVDLDVKQRFSLGEYGRATVGMTWTHIASWLRVDSSRSFQYAGTHGNCDTSNCAGTPKDKINLVASWDKGDWNVTGTVNYRADMKNVSEASDTTCANTFADGSPAPSGCRLASFTTLDLSARYNYTKNLQFLASVNNAFDKVAPLDPLTYGGMSYNPMDASGAIGRYYKVSVRYQF